MKKDLRKKQKAPGQLPVPEGNSHVFDFSDHEGTIPVQQVFKAIDELAPGAKMIIMVSKSGQHHLLNLLSTRQGGPKTDIKLVRNPQARNVKDIHVQRLHHSVS